MTPYDDEVVRRRLQYLAHVVDRLEADLPDRIEDLAAEAGGMAMDAAQHRLVVAVQAVADTAAHIAVCEGFGPPESYGAAVRSLSAGGILPDDLAERLARAVGLRNVLVHLYLEVDPQRVIRAIEARDDFRRFISHVWEWLDAE